jgi:hemerythrin superfamily protein
VDAIELLKHDHRMVEQLFRDYEAAGGPPGGDEQRRGVVDITIRELSKHAALEELMFYPFAKKVLPDDAEQIDEHLSEHMAVKKVLSDLDSLSAGDDREAQLMTHLQHEIEEHVQEEETDLMVRVRNAADAQSLDELGEAIDKAKSTAPTRPHPAAPDEPPGLAAAAPVAAIYDRLRDRLQGRPQT